MDGQGYSCWCENGYEYIKHKIDLNNIDGSVAMPNNLPLRDRLVCNDIDELTQFIPAIPRVLLLHAFNLSSAVLDFTSRQN